MGVECFENALTREKVMWASDIAMKGKAVGKDGIYVEMMSAGFV